MAALFMLLAIAGTAVVADLVLENVGAGAITVLHHPISGYRDGLCLAVAAAPALAKVTLPTVSPFCSPLALNSVPANVTVCP